MSGNQVECNCSKLASKSYSITSKIRSAVNRTRSLTMELVSTSSMNWTVYVSWLLSVWSVKVVHSMDDDDDDVLGENLLL